MKQCLLGQRKLQAAEWTNSQIVIFEGSAYAFGYRVAQ